MNHGNIILVAGSHFLGSETAKRLIEEHPEVKVVIDENTTAAHEVSIDDSTPMHKMELEPLIKKCPYEPFPKTGEKNRRERRSNKRRRNPRF